MNWYKEGVHPHWIIPKRQFLDVTFTGDTTIDRIKLNFGQVYIRELLANKDTVHGIDFHFSDRSTYATLVGVLDICNMEDARTYAPSDNGIKIYYIRFEALHHLNIL